jgi:hypothetical protein
MPQSLQTRAFEVRQHSGLTKVPGSYTKPDALPDGSPQPKVDNDLFGRLNIEQNIQASDGPVLTFDVLPDFRYIILYLAFFITRAYKTLEQRDDPYLSPATLMAYCLSLIYAHLLTCDRYIRIKPSAACKEFIDDPELKRYHSTLLNAWVPPFVADLIDILTPMNDPRRPGIEYIPSAAASSFNFDFGRTFPVSIFTKFHDILARTSTRTEPHILYKQWYDFAVIGQYAVANYFGAAATADAIYENWLLSTVISMMNPVVSRYIANRPVFARTPTSTITGTAITNPYVVLLAATDDNIDMLVKFIKSMSAHALEHLDARIQLGASYDNLVGTTLLIHCVSEPSLPTYHSKTHKLDGKSEPKEQSSSDFASKIKWLIDLEFKAPGTPLTFPEKVVNAVKDLLRLTKESYDPDNDKDKFILFDKKRHITNDQRVFDPYDYSASKAAFPVVSGLRIETFELDGFEVPNINMRSSLHDDNAQALQATVPMDKIRPATSADQVSVILRAANDEYQQKTSLSLYDMSRNRISRSPLDIMNPGSLPLYDESTTPRDWTLLINKFSWPTSDPDRPSTLPDKFICAWSSFRHIPKYKSQSKMTDNDYLVLLSLRPMFGTNVTMFQIEHGSRLIPRA